MTDWANKKGHNPAAPCYDFRGAVSAGTTPTNQIYFTCSYCGENIEEPEWFYIDREMNDNHATHIRLHEKCFLEVVGEYYKPQYKESYVCFHCDKPIHAGEVPIYIGYKKRGTSPAWSAFHEDCFYEIKGQHSDILPRVWMEKIWKNIQRV